MPRCSINATELSFRFKFQEACLFKAVRLSPWSLNTVIVHCTPLKKVLVTVLIRFHFFCVKGLHLPQDCQDKLSSCQSYLTQTQTSMSVITKNLDCTYAHEVLYMYSPYKLWGSLMRQLNALLFKGHKGRCYDTLAYRLVIGYWYQDDTKTLFNFISIFASFFRLHLYFFRLFFFFFTAI